MVLHHVVDGFGFQDTLAIQLTLVEQHLREACVVVQRGGETAAAAFSLRAQEEVARGRIREDVPGIGLRVTRVDRGEAGTLCLGEPEAGVFHRQRSEDVLFEIVAELLAAELLDDCALQVDGDGVAPLFTWLGEQWDFRHALYQCGQVFLFHRLVGDVGAVDGVAGREAVTEAGGVGHHLVHRRRAIGGHEIVEIV